MKVQKIGEMHILSYRMLDIKHWQSTLGTKSFAGQHLWSSVILSYCCVSTHKHLETKKYYCWNHLVLLLLTEAKVYSKVEGNRFDH